MNIDSTTVDAFSLSRCSGYGESGIANSCGPVSGEMLTLLRL